MRIFQKPDSELTLKSLCDFARVRVPANLRERQNEVIPQITCFANRVKTGDVLFIRPLLEDGKPASRSYSEGNARTAWKNGAQAIFSTEQYYGEGGERLPCVIVRDPRKLFWQLCRDARDRFPADTLVVGITGSVGKTTTTEMVELVSQRKGGTFCSRNNSNGFASIAGNIRNLPEETAVYVQEVGAYFPGLIEEGASLLRPHACIVTNIGTSHIEQYGSVAGILQDKLALARHMGKDGMAFLNYDDPMLRSAGLNCRVTWFSADDPAADYHAENVAYRDDCMEYDIVGKGERQPIRLYSCGVHNVINSVAAYAYGRWLGLEGQEIADALASHKTSGIRQNLCNVGGYRLFMDCYNSTPVSLKGAVETIAAIPVAEGGKRIAVIADMLQLGPETREIHAGSGRELAAYPVDVYLCYGPLMRHTADELKKAGRYALHTEVEDQLVFWLWQHAAPGDLILCKGSHSMALSRVTDRVFGTSFYLTDRDLLLERKKTFQTETVSGVILDGMAEVRSAAVKNGVAAIPAAVNGVPVKRVGAEVFSKNYRLKKLVIAGGVTNIGVAACYICTGLTELVLPSSLRRIERSAFNYCTNLKTVTLPDSVIHIDRRAFYDCFALEKIVIGVHTAYIGSEAFANCQNLTIYGVPGSYAERYAQAEGIPFRAHEQLTIEH